VQLQGEIHLGTTGKHIHFTELFQHHERQLLNEVGTKATGPRSVFAKKIAQRKTAPEKAAYRAANMTSDKRVQFRVCLSDTEIEATTWSITEMDRIVNPLKRVISGITSKHQMQFMKESSIHLVKFEAWWQAISIQEL
jgi:hypothetical protein